MSGITLRLLYMLVLVAASQPARAIPAVDARSAAIGWLEANQNSDGSWGLGSTQSLTTAEALLALAKAQRGNGIAAKRAIAWLRNRHEESLDFRARALRALAGVGVDISEEVQHLDSLGESELGWGPTEGAYATSYDTALVAGAIRADGITPQGWNTGPLKSVELFVRRQRDDTGASGGWSGDWMRTASQGEPSDRTVTAEIIRGVALLENWNSSARVEARQFISTDGTVGGAPVDATTPTLEIASRLAALHAISIEDGGLRTELLDDARFTNGVWSQTDALVNALGLLAVTTEPNATFVPNCPDPEDADCDGTKDVDDAFPHDPSEQVDSDGDGVGDVADADRDGDGYCDSGQSGGCVGQDSFEDDPTEFADNDGDTVGDHADSDDDGDGVVDGDEVENGTDPLAADTDGDEQPDLTDPCPLTVANVDADNDGICVPFDECDLVADAEDTGNLDGDGECDGADEDDDGDGFSDRIELAAGADPRDDGSTPGDLGTTDPNGDFDRDGLSNGEETATSPFLADSDGDGSTDYYEINSDPSTDPMDPSSQPRAILAVMSSVSTLQAGDPEPLQPEITEIGLRASMTGGQTTPVTLPGDPQEVAAGGDARALVGFQPQTLLGRDLDGDELSGELENAQRTSSFSIDTDVDGFVDGFDGVIARTAVPDGYDLDGDTFADGELSVGTDPANAAERPGKPGDVAPLGNPDGMVTAADALVEIRLVADPSLVDGLAPDNERIATEAADANGDTLIRADDVPVVFQEAVERQ